MMPLLYKKSARNFCKTSLDTSHVEVSELIVDVLVNIIILPRRRDLDFLNDFKCSLSNVCYIAHNINKNEKTFKNEQRNRDAAAKKG